MTEESTSTPNDDPRTLETRGRTIDVRNSAYHSVSQLEIGSSMKGDVKRHSSSFDWKSFDVQPLATGVGSERCVAGKRFHRI